ncbi:hypothetical protein [Castellaniella caeni]|uniref:hypothetical protein n=1 Tax=Castellaniella caeni TaxID=266123 RepID=UPI000C9F131B|nr:hypothetical protein [Castellaniella caeni]
MNDQTELDALKSAMQEATDFSLVWHQFFDLASSPGFVDASDPGQLEFLVPVLNAIFDAGGAGIPRAFQAPIVLRYRDSDFYHGSVDCPEHMGAFIYFKQIDQGMLALTNVRSLASTFFRFALASVDHRCAVVLPDQQQDGPVEH